MTDQDHERHQDWDAAYVLGALTPAERREFEEHLAGCAACQAAVAELAGMPGLLGTLPSADAFALLGDPAAADPASAGSGPAPVTALIHRVRRRRRIRTVVWAGLAAVAVAAAVVIAVPPLLGSGSRPEAQIALTATTPSPLTASVALAAEPWGTRIDMDCAYGAQATGYPSSGRYGLFVVDSTGATTLVSSWTARAGQTVHTEGSIGVRAEQLVTAQVRDLATDAVLLSSAL